MQETGTLDRDRVVAWVVVLLLHAALGWGLTRLLAVAVPPHEAGTALQLVWIAATPAPPAEPAEPASRTPAAAAASHSRSPGAVATAPITAPAPAADAAPPSSAGAESGALSAVYLDQARHWARQQTAVEFRPADVLAHRAAQVPGRASALRLRERMTVADAVSVVGGWFGGPGYSADPCPELRKDVNDLSLAGDSAALQDALYYEKRACW